MQGDTSATLGRGGELTVNVECHVPSRLSQADVEPQLKSNMAEKTNEPVLTLANQSENHETTLLKNSSSKNSDEDDGDSVSKLLSSLDSIEIVNYLRYFFVMFQEYNI